MSFWEDLSAPVKGAIVVGAIALVYLGIAFFAGLPPYGGAQGGDLSVQQTRGMQRQ